MKKIFISNLRLLADLAREPLPGAAGIWRNYSLRETISANFDKVKSLGDALLFELGPSREKGLALRSRISSLATVASCAFHDTNYVAEIPSPTTRFQATRSRAARFSAVRASAYRFIVIPAFACRMAHAADVILDKVRRCKELAGTPH
jgi:hypothetical protein